MLVGKDRTNRPSIRITGALETKDDYFDYYRDYHAFWKLYGLDLPDEVLKDIYYRNALRITPGLPRDLSPNEDLAPGGS